MECHTNTIHKPGSQGSDGGWVQVETACVCQTEGKWGSWGVRSNIIGAQSEHKKPQPLRYLQPPHTTPTQNGEDATWKVLTKRTSPC